ncbi:putative chitobiose transport system substrate-binding protein [Microbacterium sp. W4I4]|uniref:ABC transporter substrate-binding protein n=1 Tax=Microbacterium sp. W4I4 TaxID=3042295 RepID=UPI00277DFE19|nr:extracellular solute-binding protein [Microbacterium sp. W4I4]MDQ0615341.1 putative chitobiose transport system substrate-binding protein [Microbacterium sp. W4I4]
MHESKEHRSHGRRRRRALIGVAAVAATATMLTACMPGGGTSSEGPGEAPEKLSGDISFWTINLKSGFADYIEGLIDGFEKKNPDVTVEWVDVPGDQIDSKFLAALSGSSTPDVVNMFSDSVSGVASRLLDLTTVLSDEALADIQPGLRDPFVIDGKQAAVPWYHSGAPVTMYRKSIMAEVPSFDLADPPSTYNDLLTLANETHDKTGKFGLNLIPSNDVFQYYGIPMLNDDKSAAAFNTSEAVEMLEKWKEAYQTNGIAPGATSTQGIPPQWIDSGETAMTVNFASMLSGIETNSPDAYKDLAVSMAPRTTDGKYLLTEMQTFVIPAESKNPHAAGAFLEYITSAKNQLDFSKLVPIYPSSVEAAKDPFFTSVSGTALTDEARKLTAAALPDLTYTGSFGTKFDSELGKVFRQGIRDYLSGSQGAADALTALEKQWNEILAG